MGYFRKYRDVITDYESFRDALERPLPVHIRINRLKTETEDVKENLEERGLELVQSSAMGDGLFQVRRVESPGNLVEYFLGHIHPQALTSCLPALVLSPKPGSYVLDMCAAPGGKTAQMAQLMENTGIIVANELFGTRHVPLAHTLARLGVLNCLLSAYQAQEFPLRDHFDYVLADVPCSGEGRFRNSGNIPLYRGGREKTLLPALQRRILLRGFDLLKVGGELLYSTCTYNPEENEAVVNHLLKERDARILPMDLDVPAEPGLLGWKNEIYESSVRGTARVYPHRVDSVGFFMARIGRRT